LSSCPTHSRLFEDESDNVGRRDLSEGKPEFSVASTKNTRSSKGSLRGQPALSVLPCSVFNFGKPKTVGDWIVHVAGAVVAVFLVWWMLKAYVL